MAEAFPANYRPEGDAGDNEILLRMPVMYDVVNDF
jgi:hypothetical protein